MALSVKVGSFSTGTPSTGGTISLTGVGFTPLVLICWWSGRTESTDAAGRRLMNRGMGWGISSSSYCAVNTWSRDNNTTSLCNREQMYRVNSGDSGILAFRTATNAVDGEANLQSMDSDGATFNVTTTFGTDFRVNYMALAGSDLTNYEIGRFTKTTSVTNTDQTVTMAGSFVPGLVFLMSSFQTTVSGASLSDSCMTIGAFDSTGAQGVWAGGGNNSAADGQTMSYCNDVECLAMFESTVTSLANRAKYKSVGTGQFTVTWIESDATASQIFYLALKGPVINVASFTTQTDTSTPITITTTGNLAAGAMLFSATKAEDAQDTPSDHDKISISGFTSTAERAAIGTADQDAASVMVVSSAVEYDEVYVNVLESAGTVQGLMDVTAINSGSISLIMDDADPVAAFGWGFFIGSTPPTVATPEAHISGIGHLQGAYTNYALRLLRDDGTRLKTLDTVGAFEYTLVANDIGHFRIELPWDIDQTLIDFHRRVAFWRKPYNGSQYLDAMGLILDIDRWHAADGSFHIAVEGAMLNYLLTCRYTAFYAGNAHVTITDNADDIIKNAASYNLGSSATTGNGRKLTASLSSTYFSVASDVSLGASLTKQFSYRNLLDVSREIAEASRNAGTDIYFDIVPADETTFQFRTYTGQRGQDRTSDQPNGLIFSHGRGLKNGRLWRSCRDQVNVAYALGPGEQDQRNIQTATDTTRNTASLFAWREGVVETRATTDAGVLSAANSLLVQGRYLQRYTADLVSQPGYTYGKDWGFGDKITVNDFDLQFDAMVRAITVRVDGNGKEDISGQIEAYL